MVLSCKACLIGFENKMQLNWFNLKQTNKQKLDFVQLESSRLINP